MASYGKDKSIDWTRPGRYCGNDKTLCRIPASDEALESTNPPHNTEIVSRSSWLREEAI
jgi:hypothetical protein